MSLASQAETPQSKEAEGVSESPFLAKGEGHKQNRLERSPPKREIHSEAEPTTGVPTARGQGFRVWSPGLTGLGFRV